MIRAIQSADWQGIDRVQRASFPTSAIESMEALRSIAEAAAGMCAVAEIGGEVCGYLLAHPWIADDLPELNKPLASCPRSADTLFIHDLAILPYARGGGLASRMVRHVVAAAVGIGIRKAALISVQDTLEFWSRFGFVDRPELTERFRARVASFTEIPFQFMTAALA